MRRNHSDFEKAPVSWAEAHDIETLSFEKATWIPLYIAKTDILRGQFGRIGDREAAHFYDSIVVPLELREKFEAVDWQSVNRNWPDSAWVDEEGEFHPPGCYNGDPRIRYAVIQQWFETGEPAQWDLLQELSVGLHLFRQGDSWIRPEENDIEVARLERRRRKSDRWCEPAFTRLPMR
jgi:hypothetical protein